MSSKTVKSTVTLNDERWIIVVKAVLDYNMVDLAKEILNEIIHSQLDQERTRI